MESADQLASGPSGSSSAPEASSSGAAASNLDTQNAPEKQKNGKGKKKNNKADPAQKLEDLTPEEKDYAPDVLKKMIIAAVQKRSKYQHTGLCHVKAVEESSIDGQVTAGYFGFHSVSAMKTYVALPGKNHPIGPLLNGFKNIALILQDYLNERKVNFGIARATTLTFKTEGFYETLQMAAQDPNSLEARDIVACRNHSQHDRYSGGQKSRTVIYVNYAITCLRLLRTPKEIGESVPFPPGGYDDTPGKEDRFMGYQFEDWNRAHWLLKWYWRENQQSRQNQSGKKREMSAALSIAKLPRYLNDEDEGGMISDDEVSEQDNAEDTKDQARRKQMHRFYKAAAAFESAIEDTDLPDEYQEMRLNPAMVDTKEWKACAERLEKKLVNVFQSTHMLKGLETRTNISKTDALHFMEEQGKNARVLWGPDDCEGMRKFLLHASTLDIHELVELATAAQNTDNDDDDDDQQDKLAWENRKKMSSKAAPIPSLSESCQWVGVSRDDLTIAEAVPDRKTGQKPTYKYHQVQSAFYMRNAERGPLKATLMALACGLGKTLIALMVVKCSNEEQRRDAAKNTDPDFQQEYAATLVLCPPQSVEVWQKDIEKFFPGVFKVWQFYGSEFSITDQKRRDTLVPPSIDALNDILLALDPHDHKTGLTLILTAHTTWYTRSLGTIGENDTRVPVYTPEEVAEMASGETDLPEGQDDEIPEGQEDETPLPEDEPPSNMVSSRPSGAEGDGDDEDEHSRRLARERKLKQPALPMDRLIAVKQRHRQKPSALKKIEARVYVSLCRYKFARILLDEAHIIRNPDTMISEAVFQTMKDVLHCLTATALLNHARDLRGYLFQVFRKGWALNLAGKVNLIDVYDKAFDPTKAPGPPDANGDFQIHDLMPIRAGNPDPDVETLWQAHERGIRLYLLDWRHFMQCGNAGKWSAATCAKIMPPILTMLQLRIGYETEINLGDGKSERVGESVPECKFYTVQLQMTNREKKVHDDKTLHMLSALGAGDPNSENGGDTRVAKTQANQAELDDLADSEGVVNTGIYRFLKHGTFDPRLCILTELNHREMTREQRAQAAKTRKNNWTNHDMDHGASMFFCRTRDGPQYGIPVDRLTLAKYLSAFSVKMRYALGILAENIRESQKTVMVFEYPMPLWLCETQLANLGIKFVALKSNMSQEERTAAIDKFNDPKSDVDVMLFTSALGGVSLNLQSAAARIIIMELPINFYLVLQILGRVNRIGQRWLQKVWMLWVDHSFDQIALHRIFKKIVASLAGEGSAADAEDPAADAQNTVGTFLGLKASHTPYHEAWSKGPYTKKDEVVRSLETKPDHDPEMEEFNEIFGLTPSPHGSPSNLALRPSPAPTALTGRALIAPAATQPQTPRKPGPSKPTQKANSSQKPLPKQHVPSDYSRAKPIAGHKRKASADAAVENPKIPEGVEPTNTREPQASAGPASENPNVPEGVEPTTNSHKRKASAEPPVEEPEKQEDITAELKELDQLRKTRDALRQTKGGNKKVQATKVGQATKKYNNAFNILLGAGHVKQEERDQPNAGLSKPSSAPGSSSAAPPSVPAPPKGHESKKPRISDAPSPSSKFKSRERVDPSDDETSNEVSSSGGLTPPQLQDN